MSSFDPESRQRAAELFEEARRRFVEPRQRAEALRLLRLVVRLHHFHVGAWNLLALAALERGRVKECEERLEEAIDAAECEFDLRLTRRAPDEPFFREWLIARKNLALVRSRRRDHLAAARGLEEVLADDPSDPLNVRWLIGEEYWKAGRTDRALEVLQRTLDEPGCRYTYALVLHAVGNAPKRDRALLRAFVANRYIAPLLLGGPLPLRRGYHPTNLSEPEWAQGYVRRMERSWRTTKGALDALRWVWSAPSVVTWRRSLEELCVRITRAGREERSALLDRFVDLVSDDRVESVARAVSDGP